jgi:hypothetical protein
VTGIVIKKLAHVNAVCRAPQNRGVPAHIEFHENSMWRPSHAVVERGPRFVGALEAWIREALPMLRE